MDYRPLNITVISAVDLKDVNRLTKMDVYVAVTVSGDPRTCQTTPVHKDAGKSPRWNHRLSFPLSESAIRSNNCLVFRIISDRVLGDKEIGQVAVTIKELMDAAAGDGERVVEYKVRTVSGKTKGTLKFSYKFGDKIAVSMPPTATPKPVAAAPPPFATAPPPFYPAEGKSSSEPVTAYPAYPPPPHSAGYPPPSYAQPYAPPPQMGHGYPPPRPGYGYPQAAGYGPPGYSGYGVVPPKKKKQGMGGLGLGLGAGLLGGLLVGDMISDVGSYDAGYDGGFDDGGFDF